MSDYSNTFGGALKDKASTTILGADWDTEYSNIATMSGTKTDKTVPAATDNVAKLDANGNLVDSGITDASVTGITGVVETRLDTIEANELLLTPRTAPSGWVRSGSFIFPNGSSAGNTAAIYSLPSGANDAWWTVGESNHTEMDGQWAALTKLTGLEVKALLISINAGIVTSSASQQDTEVWVSPRGVTPVHTVGTGQARAVYKNASVTGSEDYNPRVMCWVPVTTDSEGVSFQVRYERSLSNSGSIFIALHGAMDTLQ